MDKTTFVLDTCVLLHDPHAITTFQEHNIIIPFTTLEELDKFKKNDDNTGRNSREVARYLDKLREQGSLIEGIELDGGGKITVTDKFTSLTTLDMTINDNKILCTAYGRPDAILVTNDINLRIKADSIGVPAQAYGKNKQSADELYEGVKTLMLPRVDFTEYKKNKWIEVDSSDLAPNEYLVIENADTGTVTTGRYDAKSDRVVRLINRRDSVFGIYAQNIEQQFAFDALLNDDVKLVSMIGKAGTGKTLIAVAAGLHKIIEEDSFSKLLVSRPIQPMGNDIGYLPGDVQEKLSPWMQPIFDNLEFLFDLDKRHGSSKKKKRGAKEETKPVQTKKYDHLIDEGILQVEALTYIRGRSIPGQYMIIDEAQNLSPHEIKTIITRAGQGTKIILTGDTQQIDSPYLDETSNGLAYAIDKMKHLELTAHVVLTQGERSELAEAGSVFL